MTRTGQPPRGLAVLVAMVAVVVLCGQEAWAEPPAPAAWAVVDADTAG